MQQHRDEAIEIIEEVAAQIMRANSAKRDRHVDAELDRLLGEPPMMPKRRQAYYHGFPLDLQPIEDAFDGMRSYAGSEPMFSNALEGLSPDPPMTVRELREVMREAGIEPAVEEPPTLFPLFPEPVDLYQRRPR